MKTILRPFSTAVACLCGFLVAQSSFATTWTGASGVDLNWSTLGNWLEGTSPNDTAVLFVDDGADGSQGNVNNIIATSRSVASLRYSNTNNYHTTQINPGVTLTVNGNLLVGTETSNIWVSVTTITGSGGTLQMPNTGSTLTVRQGANGVTGAGATLDLSGLDTFSATIGRVSVGDFNINRSTGILLLAKTNTITASGSTPQISLGLSGSNNGAGQPTRLSLGQTNVIFASSIAVARQKQTAVSMVFNNAFPDAVAYFRASDGVSRISTWTIGDGENNSGTTGCNGTCDFTGGSVDAMVTTMTVGRASNNTGGTSGGNSRGTLTMTSGIIDVDTLQVGIQPANNGFKNGDGTVNINGGVLKVNTVLQIGQATGGTAAASTVGRLNITSGAAYVNEIDCAPISGGSDITVFNGTLLVSNLMGSAAAPIRTLAISDSTLGLSAANGSPSAVVTSLNTGGSANTLNVLSVPTLAAYPSQFELIRYSGASFGVDFTLGSLPGTFQGYISNDNSSAVWLVITNGPSTAKNLIWSGSPGGDWNVGVGNWLLNGSSSTYGQGDFVTFDDSASGTTTVNLATDLMPSAITFSNDNKSYTFTGTGGISGNTSIVKEGAASVTIANSGNNSFSGSVALNAGSLIFNRPDTNTFANAINGAGAVAKNGSATLTLSGASSFSGGLSVNAGTLRLAGATAAGSGSVLVNKDATLVAGAANANSITISNATLGGGSGVGTLSGGLTAADATTNTVYIADPENLAFNGEMNFTGTLSGGGDIKVLSGTNNPNPDGSVGFRLRGTSDGGYSGTITFGQSVKGEIQTSQGGPFSPAGSGKFVLTGGAYDGTNSLNGTYSEFNVRNNSGSDTTFGNDIRLAGSGIGIVNPLGTAPVGALVTMGNLTIGGGQILGVHLNNGNAHNVVFPTVSITGGSPVFMPGIPGLGAVTAVGSDLTLGDISQNAAGSGLVMGGFRTLFVAGNASYSGVTLVTNGTLQVNGSLTGGGGVTVSGGRLAGSGNISGNVTVQPGGTISPGASVGTLTISGALTLQGTTVMEIDRSGNQMDLIQGAASIAYGGTLVISNINDPFQNGDSFKLFDATQYSGSFTIVPATPADGLAWDTSHLKTDGTLRVSIPPPQIGTIGIVAGEVVVSGSNGTAFADYYVLTSTNPALPVSSWLPMLTNQFDSDGNFSFNAGAPTGPQRYFLIQKP